MTVKLTQKLLENQRRGKRTSVADVARKVSEKMARTQGEGAFNATTKSQSGKDLGGQTEGEDDEASDVRRNYDLGPPGFYDADLTNYYSKFDVSLKERKEFKHRMRDKMSFTNQDWNRNCELLSTSNGHRKSKQIIRTKGGIEKLTTKDPYKPDNLEQTNQTFLKTKKERPPSRGSTRAHTVLDFDWYGNARDVSQTKLLI